MILVPLLAAVLVTLTRSSLGVARVLALAGSVAVLVLAILLPGTRPFDAPWLPGIGVSFSLDGNGAGAVLAFAAALMMIPAILVATTRVAKGAATLAALLLVAQAGLNGIFLAKDLVLFYVFWEATLIPSLLLLGIYGGEKRREATVKYLVYAVTGSFFMLVSMLALKTLSGAASFHIIDLTLVTPNLPVATQTWLFIGLAIGMAVKLPIWPLHSWLVDLNEQNHPSGAADVLGSLYKVGAFGFFAWALPQGIYFKTDEQTAPRFDAAGSAVFLYDTKDGPRSVGSYRRMPDACFDDEDALRDWAGLAWQAAMPAPAKPKRKGRAAGP